MSVTFEQLYRDRCYEKESKMVPHFWNPLPLKEVPLTLFGSVNKKVRPEWGVEKTIQKVLALGLFLELPVGNWILELSRRESDSLSDALKLLLASNVRDEASHDKGIRYCAEQYPISDEIMKESETISQAWLTSGSTPIESACFAESGVFLASLSILRLAGGSELASVAEQISVDEFRHVATNRGVMELLGMNSTKPSSKMQSLISDTLSWVTEDLKIPGAWIGRKFDFNQDFLLRSSKEIVSEGIAGDLNDLLNFAVYKPPFEVSNVKNYSRVSA